MRNTVYLIVNRYDTEAYYFYDDKIYTDLSEAKKAWKECLHNFLSYGPDDLSILSLVECNLTANKLKELKKHLKNYKENPDCYAYEKEFYNFMSENANIYNHAIYGLNGYDGCEEIIKAIESDKKDCEDDDVFTEYFNEYYKKYYE